MPEALIERVPEHWPHRTLSRSVRVGPLHWHVQVGGTGPTVLLLHGTGASAHSWSGVIERLLPHVTVVAPDLPGHGFTEGAAARDLTLPHIAADLDTLIATLGLPPVALVVGHSAGAPLAIRWAIETAVPPQALLGFNPALVGPPQAYTDLIAPFLVPLTSAVASRIPIPAFFIRKLLRSTNSDVGEVQSDRYALLFRQPNHIRGSIGLMAATDLPALYTQAQRLTCPALFVLGQQDQWIPRTALNKVLAEWFDFARVETWPGGHLVHEEDPQRAATLMLQMIGLGAFANPVVGSLAHGSLTF